MLVVWFLNFCKQRKAEKKWAICCKWVSMTLLGCTCSASQLLTCCFFGKTFFSGFWFLWKHFFILCPGTSCHSFSKTMRWLQISALFSQWQSKRLTGESFVCGVESPIILVLNLMVFIAISRSYCKLRFKQMKGLVWSKETVVLCCWGND